MKLQHLKQRLNVAVLVAFLGTTLLAVGCADDTPLGPTAELSDDIDYVGGGSKADKDGGGKKDKSGDAEAMDGGGKYAVGGND